MNKTQRQKMDRLFKKKEELLKNPPKETKNLIKSRDAVKPYLIYRGESPSSRKPVPVLNDMEREIHSKALARFSRICDIIYDRKIFYNPAFDIGNHVFCRTLNRYDMYILNRTTLGFNFDGEKFTETDFPLSIPFIDPTKTYKINESKEDPTVKVTVTIVKDSEFTDRVETRIITMDDSDLVNRIHIVKNRQRPMSHEDMYYILFGED